MTIIHPEVIDTVVLKSGSHESLEAGACLLEAVSYVAGEPWSDRPECVCPALAAFGRTWNDALDDDTRNRLLKPLIPKLIGTRSTPDVQDRRGFMASDWAVRTFTVAWLRKAGLNDDADALAALPELSSVELCKAAMPTILKVRASASAARDAAWDAARAAAWDAAWAAAWAAAGDAAWAAAGAAAWAAAGDAAGDAAWAAAGAAAGDAARAAAWAAAGDAARAAAWDAARDAAWDAARAAARAAARDAAWDAARAAARDALQDTVTELQASALDLYERMIAVQA